MLIQFNKCAQSYGYGYFRSTMYSKEDCIDAIFRPCRWKIMPHVDRFPSAWTENSIHAVFLSVAVLGMG